MKRYLLTYQVAPAWRVGEDGELRRLNAPNRAAAIGDAHYPDDYCGRIQSCQPTTRKLGSLRTKGFWWSMVVELDKATLGQARQRKLKVSGKVLVPTTWEDRWGALAEEFAEKRVEIEALDDPPEPPVDPERIIEERGAEEEPQTEEEMEAARQAAFARRMEIERLAEEAKQAEHDRAELGYWMKRKLRALPRNIAHTGAGYYVTDDNGATTSDTVSAYNDNKLLYSEDFSDAYWLKVRCSIFAHSSVAPIGRANAWRLYDTTDNGTHVVYRSVTPDGASRYFLSVIAKAGTLSQMYMYLPHAGFPATPQATFDLSDGSTINSAGVDDVGSVDLGGGWYRYYIAATSDAAAGGSLGFSPAVGGVAGYAGTGTDYILIQAASFEASVALPSYKPTRGASDTSITLQAGGLTDGDHDGELANFTVADNDFQVIRSGVDSILVVGDATGEGGAATGLTFTPHVTIQGGCDQVFTDQGAATFTASQYIRIFADDGSPTTYAENVVPNAALVPDADLGFHFVIEGDPAASRSDIVIGPASGRAFYCSGPDGLRIRHLKFTSIDNVAIYLYSGTAYWHISDIEIVTANNAGYFYRMGLVEDSVVTCTGAASWGFYGGGAQAFRRCRFINTSGASSKYALGNLSHLGSAEGCFFSGWSVALSSSYYPGTHEAARIVNCTIKDCTCGIVFGHYNAVVNITVLNTIFDGTTYPFRILRTAVWPEETAARFGPKIICRDSYFYGYTGVLYDGTTAKTYAEFMAYNLVEDVDNKDDEDPLVNADGTLQAGSPCPNAGVGAGVVTDTWGVTTPTPSHPAIGCDFSRDLAEAWPLEGDVDEDDTAYGPGGDDYAGAYVKALVADHKLGVTYGAAAEFTGTGANITDPDAPTWQTPAATPADGQVTLHVTANADGDDVYARYRLSGDGNSWSSESDTFRHTGGGDGDITVTGLTNDAHYEFQLYSKGADGLDSYWSDPRYATPVASSLAATGPMSLPMSALKDLLAESSTFQAWTGAENAEEAKDFIHVAAQEKDSWTRPCALVTVGEAWEREAIAGGARNHFTGSGSLELWFEGEVPEAYRADSRDAETWFLNRCGAVVTEMEALAGSSGYLVVANTSLLSGPARAALDEAKTDQDYYQVRFGIDWGP